MCKHDVGTNYLVFLVPAEVTDAVFLEQLVVVFLGHSLLPAKREQTLHGYRWRFLVPQTREQNGKLYVRDAETNVNKVFLNLSIIVLQQQGG